MANGDGATPGNGRGNPFGNGQGDTGAMANRGGNNFTTNPSPAPSTTRGGGQPGSYGQSIPQQRGADPTGEGSVDGSGGTAAESPQANPNADPGNPIGAGSVGNGGSPMRLR